MRHILARKRDPTGLSRFDISSALVAQVRKFSFQILSGQKPYYNIDDDVLVALALTQRRTPDRPDTQALVGRDEYWSFIQRCWSKEPAERPNADEAHKELVRFRDEVLG